MKTKKPITIRDIYVKYGAHVVESDKVIMSDQLGRIETLLMEILQVLRTEFERGL